MNETALAHHRLESEARKPWLYAEGLSWWDVTGFINERHTFTNCLAQVVPADITGVDDGDGFALFHVHMVGTKPHLVEADQITLAHRLVFVMADEPKQAYYLNEQDFLRAGGVA